MRKIEVTGEGVTVTFVTEPLISMYGKEMRPGATSVDALPWDEISCVSLASIDLAPDGERWLQLTVDLTMGEFFDIDEKDEGFMDAVRELCRLSGIAVPDLAAVTSEVIWPRPEPA